MIPLVEIEIEKPSREDIVSDYKTQLQYLVQKKYKICPDYFIIKEEGPPHDKKFYTELKIEGKKLSTGSGQSKKKAEQDAAKKALEMIEKKEIFL